jgi:hypothetical protein
MNYKRLSQIEVVARAPLVGLRCSTLLPTPEYTSAEANMSKALSLRKQLVHVETRRQHNRFCD